DAPLALERDLGATARGLGADGAAWEALLAPLVEGWPRLAADLLAPVAHRPGAPWLLARFGLSALRSARGLAQARFGGPRARALTAGLAAHGGLPLERAGTAAFALVLAAAGHRGGWPLVRGGSQGLADALASLLGSLGGEVQTGTEIRTAADLPPARAVLWDVTPRQLLRIAGARLPPAYARRLRRYRYGAGAFKLDWALSEPIPWAVPECRRAATVHLGGTLEEIAASEGSVARGRPPERPYVIAVQPTLFDPSRAPAGRHTAWAYCHLPNGSTFDMTGRLEAQIERFAPGFRDCILARSAQGPAALEAHNPNYLGGDIGGGAQDLAQTWARPVAGPRPYAVPVPGWYLCSSSTPPGGGVHGMCGYHGARLALREVFGRPTPPLWTPGSNP
ncbi:MAG: phytoene desaturase family protein, partial [Deferrisomatales bacterium]